MFEFGRIQLRPFEMEDIENLHEWHNDDIVMLYSRGHPFQFKNKLLLNEEMEKKLKNKDKVLLAVELREDGRFIGITKYSLGEWGGVRSTSIGTLIGEKDCWDKGYGKEITLALCEILFMWKNYERLEAWSIEYNKRAHKVLEYYVFKKEEILELVRVRLFKRGILGNKRRRFKSYAEGRIYRILRLCPET
jgi:RimJ/RimL family protein N-acetyltransferase